MSVGSSTAKQSLEQPKKASLLGNATVVVKTVANGVKKGAKKTFSIMKALGSAFKNIGFAVGNAFVGGALFVAAKYNQFRADHTSDTNQGKLKKATFESRAAGYSESSNARFKSASNNYSEAKSHFSETADEIKSSDTYQTIVTSRPVVAAKNKWTHMKINSDIKTIRNYLAVIDTVPGKNKESINKLLEDAEKYLKGESPEEGTENTEQSLQASLNALTQNQNNKLPDALKEELTKVIDRIINERKTSEVK